MSIHERPERAGTHDAGAGYPRWDARPTLRCLLTTVHPERGLSRALVQHLTLEMPDIEFTLRAQPSLGAVWICGYEAGTAHLVRELRERHPHSLLVVTGRGPVSAWRKDVLDAGADYACSWPLPFGELNRILHRRKQSPLAQ